MNSTLVNKCSLLSSSEIFHKADSFQCFCNPFAQAAQ